jgi:hypothetical protein
MRNGASAGAAGKVHAKADTIQANKRSLGFIGSMRDQEDKLSNPPALPIILFLDDMVPRISIS